MDDDANAIKRRRQQWVAAVNAGDVNRYLDLLAEDVVWLPPGQPAVSGRDAFAAWVDPFFQRYHYEFVLKAPKVTVAGDWAVERGAFETTMTSKADGQSDSHEGTYLVLWRRAAGDVWRIERYIDETQVPRSAT